MIRGQGPKAFEPDLKGGLLAPRREALSFWESCPHVSEVVSGFVAEIRTHSISRKNLNPDAERAAGVIITPAVGA